jgi:hypothetical protein
LSNLEVALIGCGVFFASKFWGKKRKIDDEN